MHFADTPHSPSWARFLIVAAVHMSLLGLIVHSLGNRMFTRPDDEPVLILSQAELPKPKPQAEPESSPPQIKSKIYVPPDIPVLPVTPVTDGPPLIISRDPAPQVPRPDTGKGGDDGVLPVQKKSVQRLPARADAADCVKPAYPASALRNGEEGVVTLAFLIGKENQVLEAKVLTSSGSRVLDKAALQALSLCRFQAASVDGAPEVAWAKMEYVWHID